jgi:ribosomal protein L44E
MPKNENAAQICPSCSTWAKHPYLQFKQNQMSDIEKMAMAASIGTAAVWGGSPPKDLFRRKSTKKEIWNYRPSVAIPRHLAVTRWPESQPRYDPSTRRESSGEYLFNQDEDIFNIPGNMQSYFPPQLIRLTDMDREIRDDDRHPINKTGRMGLVPICITCNTKGLVRDAEGDIVMCKTDAANTVAMGKGQGEWDRLCDKNICFCPFWKKGQSVQTWVYPDEVSL